MADLLVLLRNRNVIFLLAIAAGLSTPWATPVTRHLLLPALAMAMTLSTLEIASGAFKNPRALFFPALIGIVMNYVILGNIIIGLATLFIRNEAIWSGFVLLAAVPPAIAVIPFTGILRGNNTLSLFGTVGSHLGGLVIIPLIALGLLGASSLDPVKLLITISALIVLPVAASRLLIRKGWKARIDPYRGVLTNWSFFVVLYTMIGLNRNLLLGGSSMMLPSIAILIASTFVLGFLIDWVGGLLHIPKETRTSLVLLGTLKNQGTAGGLALTFFSQEAALPAALSTIVMIFYVIWLDIKKRWD